jgi:hypothetical protein
MGKNQGQTRGQRADNASTGGGATATAAPARRAAKKGEPKMYRARERGYIDGIIREPGEVFATADTAGSWMEPLKGKGQGALADAVDDTMASKKDDADLTTFSLEALQGEALRLGLTDATGLDKDDLIVAIRAAYVNEAQ